MTAPTTPTGALAALVPSVEPPPRAPSGPISTAAFAAFEPASAMPAYVARDPDVCPRCGALPGEDAIPCDTTCYYVDQADLERDAAREAALDDAAERAEIAAATSDDRRPGEASIAFAARVIASYGDGHLYELLAEGGEGRAQLDALPGDDVAQALRQLVDAIDLTEIDAEDIEAYVDAVADEVDARRCRECGCTDRWGCPGGCSWVEGDLCSACAPDTATPREVITAGILVEVEIERSDRCFILGRELATGETDGRGFQVLQDPASALHVRFDDLVVSFTLEEIVGAAIRASLALGIPRPLPKHFSLRGAEDAPAGPPSPSATGDKGGA